MTWLPTRSDASMLRADRGEDVQFGLPVHDTVAVEFGYTVRCQHLDTVEDPRSGYAIRCRGCGLCYHSRIEVSWEGTVRYEVCEYCGRDDPWGLHRRRGG